MVQFMSQSDFAAGGPYAGGSGSAATGFAKLGEVLANAPMVRARAGYYGAEAQRAQLQAEQLRQQMGVTTGRQQRIAEAMAILSTPGALHNPQNAARLSAIALADPDIAAHFPGLLAGITAAGALSKAYTDEEAAKTSAASGVAAYGNTAPGFQRSLAQGNQNIITTAQQQRLTDDNQTIVAIPPNAPPGAQGVSMSRGQAKAQGWTEIPPSAVATNVGPTTIMPAQGGPPALTSTGRAQATNAQPVLPSDTVKGATASQIFWPPSGQGNAPGATGPFQTPVTLPPSNAGNPPSNPPTPPAPTPPALTPPPQQTGQNDTSPPSSDTASNQPPPNTPDGGSINLARAELESEDDSGDGSTQPAPGSAQPQPPPSSTQPPPSSTPPPPQGGSDLAALMSGVKLAQAQPSADVPGAVMAAGPGAGTPPPPPQAPSPTTAASTQANQPPPTPPPTQVSTTATPSPVSQPPAQSTDPNQPSPQSPLADQFLTDQQKRASQVGDIWRRVSGEAPLIPPVVDVPPDTEKKIKAAISASAPTRYPLDPSATMGSQGYPAQWSPEAYDAIHTRVGQLFASTDPRFRGNVDTSIQQAISELQTGGRIPPAGYAKPQSYGGDWFGGWGVGGGSHNIPLAPPGSKFDAQGNQIFPNQGGAGNKATPPPPTPNASNPPNASAQPAAPAQPKAQAQPQMRIVQDPKTGQKYGQYIGSGKPYFPIDANNQPIQSNAQGQ